MNAISPINSQREFSFLGKDWNYYRDLASIVCSRESTYRTALDVTGFDIPTMTAALFRNFKSFLEAAFEGLTATLTIGLAPKVTQGVGYVCSKFIFKKDEQKDTLNYLMFTMDELRDKNKFQNAASRIKEEEMQDKNFTAALYERAGHSKQAERFKKEAKEIEDFCTRFTPSEDIRQKICKLKKATIIGESFLEGGFWGGFGLLMRGFRKYVLGEDRFTGTKGYVSDSESEQLGESGDLNIFQKIIGVAAIFISPVLNLFLLNKVEDDEAVAKSPFLQTVKSQWDMTHGVYPKLGLLFSYTTIPKWIGAISLSQGWFERGERILKLLTVLPSWWFGHRITNGVLAAKEDTKLAEKHNVPQGILVEPEYLKSNLNENSSVWKKINATFPEPAKIHHVMDSTEGNEVLQKEAEDLHASCLYKGFALHSLLVFLVNLGVNFTTKLRAERALGE